MLKRYSQFDTSEKGTNGAAVSDLLTIPEFQTNPLMVRIVELYTDPEHERVFPESFLYMCAALSSKTSVDKKRKFAFR